MDKKKILIISTASIIILGIAYLSVKEVFKLPPGDKKCKKDCKEC